MDRDLLTTLLRTVSVSGNEEINQLNALKAMKDISDEQYVDAVGNAVSVIHPEAPFKVLLCGHMDEIGFRVTRIDDEGFIHVQRAGGVSPKLYIGQPMQIIHEADGQKVNAVGAVSHELLEKEKLEDTDLILDIGASGREEALSRVSVGDSVCADTQVRALGEHRLTCRALDDKAGAFVILEAARRARALGATCGIYAHTAVGEETTGRGAYFAAERIGPDCAIVVDVTWASDGFGANADQTGEIKLGGGPVLCLSGMTNKPLNRLMEQVARDREIPLQYEVAGGRTYTDGDTISKTGMGVPVVLVSIPLRYMHSSAEVADWRDLEWAVELIAQALCRLEAGLDMRPFSLG